MNILVISRHLQSVVASKYRADPVVLRFSAQCELSHKREHHSALTSGVSLNSLALAMKRTTYESFSKSDSATTWNNDPNNYIPTLLRDVINRCPWRQFSHFRLLRTDDYLLQHLQVSNLSEMYFSTYRKP